MRRRRHLKILLLEQVHLSLCLLAIAATTAQALMEPPDLWRRHASYDLANTYAADYEWLASSSQALMASQEQVAAAATESPTTSPQQPPTPQGAKSGPVFTQEPPGLIHYLNSSDLVVACAASGQPAPTISWWQGGQQLEPGSLLDKRYIRYDNSLVISAFKPAQYEQDIHSATYRCQAANAHGTIVSRDVVINAVIDQDYEASVQDQFVAAGNDVAFKCQLPGQARPLVQVTGWLEDGRRLPVAHLLAAGLNTSPASAASSTSAKSSQQQQPPLKAAMLPDGRLYLARAGQEEANRSFRCQLRHQLSGRQWLSSLAGRLFVTEAGGATPARLVDSMGPVTLARPGEPLLLGCLAQGSPRPHMRWQRRAQSAQDWQDLAPSANETYDAVASRFQLLQEGNLLLWRPQLAHDQRARFRCLANNSYGQQQAETELRLEVAPRGRQLELEPRLEFISLAGPRSPLQQVSIDNNRPIQLNCTLRSGGWPLLRVEWLHDGRPLMSIGLPGFLEASATQQPTSDWPLNGSSLFDLRQDQELSAADAGPEEASDIEEHLEGEKAARLETTTLERLNSPREEPKRRVWQRLTPLGADQLLYQLHIGRPHGKRDRGAYQCRARTSRGPQLQATAHLMPRDQPPQFVDHFGAGRLVSSQQVGESVSLKCVASGSPLPEISWSLSGWPVPESSRFRVGDYVTRDALIVSFVNISSVRPEDGGLYECLATNDGGQLRHAGWLNVTGAPVVRPMGELAAVAGHQLAVMCPAGGWPLDQVSWFQNSSRLPLNHRQKLFPNGSLVVGELNEVTDAGQYSCQARSGDLVATGHLRVQIKVPPLIEPFAFAKSLQRGQRYNIMCQVVRGDLPVAIRWLKDGRPLASSNQQDSSSLAGTSGSDEEVEVRHLGPYSSALGFDPIEARHRGAYTCEASNEAGRANQTASLVIHVPPEWRLEPRDLSVTVGRTAVIDCQADAFPAARIEWRLSQDFEREPPSEFKPIISSPYMRVFENGSLIIYNTQRTDAGHYLCQASNGVPPGLSRVVKLTVHVAAHFKTKIRSELVKRGQPARLKCEALGELPLEISWLRNKAPIYASDEPRYLWQRTQLPDGLLSELTIPETERHDSGLFTCLAQNAYGQDDTSFQLLIQSVPEQPRFLLEATLNRTEARSALISWQAPDAGNSPLHKYVLMFGELSASTASSIQNITIAPNETQLQLQQLAPLTDYQLQLVAINQLGSSRPSEPLRFRTRDEAPSEPIQFVKATPLSSRSIRLRWRLPERRSHSGQMDGFYIGYQPVSASSTPLSERQKTYKTVNVEQVGSSSSETQQPGNVTTTTTTTKSNPREYETLLTGLKRGRKYSITLQGFNKMGAGPISEPLTVETWRVDVPEPPHLRMVARTARSIHLAWRLADATSQNELPASLAGSNMARIRQFASLEHTQLQMRSSSASNFQQVDAAKQPLDEEEALAELEQAQEPILGFILTRQQLLAPGQQNEKTNQPVEMRLPSDHLSQVVEGLQCGTRYQFTVAAMNSVGVSAPSDPLTVKTEGSAPVAPDKSSLLSLNGSSVPSSAVLINLGAWHNGACAMRSFELMFKPSRSSKWKPLGQVLAPTQQPQNQPLTQRAATTMTTGQQQQQQSLANQTILLEELSPQLNYDLKIVAVNEAGATEALYTFSTALASLASAEPAQDTPAHSLSTDTPSLGAGLSELFLGAQAAGSLFAWLLLLLALSSLLSVACLLLARRRHASSSSCSLSLSSASRSNQSSGGGQGGLGGVSSNFYVTEQQQQQALNQRRQMDGSKTLQVGGYGGQRGASNFGGGTSSGYATTSTGPRGGGAAKSRTTETLDEEEESPMLGYHLHHHHQQPPPAAFDHLYGRHLATMAHSAQVDQQQQPQKSNYAYVMRPSSPQPTEVNSVLGAASEAPTEMCLGASALSHTGRQDSQATGELESSQQTEPQGYYVASMLVPAHNAGSVQAKPSAKSSTLPANCHLIQHLLQQQQADQQQQQHMMDSNMIAQQGEQAYLSNIQQPEQQQQQLDMAALLEQQLQQQVYATVKRGCPRPPRLCDYTIYQCPSGGGGATLGGPNPGIDQQQLSTSMLRCCAAGGEQQPHQVQPGASSEHPLVCYHQLEPATGAQVCLQQQQQQQQQASDYQQLRPVN